MAFGIRRKELNKWKEEVLNHQISFLTHFWIDERFPGCYTVTKVGCGDINKLKKWGQAYGLQPGWIDMKTHYPHFDLFGDKQVDILRQEGKWEQINRFGLKKNAE